MAKSWLSSPFGIKILINLYGKGFKNELNTATNVKEILKIQENFEINNRLFLLSSNKQCTMQVKNYLNVQTTIFDSHQEFVIAVKNWVQQYGCFHQFTPENYTNGPGLLINVCMYKGAWKCQKDNLMTIYNSFNYTEDIKYEPRILVVPLSDGMLLAIIVPKENDESRDLAIELKERGLTAALDSIKPAFAVTCKQPVPTLSVESAIELRGRTDETTLTQYGEIRTDESGVHVKVVTCLPLKDKKLSDDYRTPQTSGKCLNFAIVYKNIPIFTGQVLP